MGIAFGNGASAAYAYDTADRLTSLTQTLTDGSGNGWTRSYNPADQVLTHVLSNPNWVWSQIGSNDNRTADGLNRDASVVAVNGYDANGNETIDKNGVRYDVENRLVSESGGPAPLSLAYDPLGRLSQTTASGTTTTTFLYDGSRLVAEYSGSTLLRRYVHGPGTDEPLVWLEGTDFTQPHYLHADPQGSILAWSNASGAMGAINAYDPYGVPQTWSGSRFAYTGQIMLPEAQLYHYKARAYDPAFGRFLQTDPVGYKADLDLYSYVQEDPTDKTDPTGLAPDGDYHPQFATQEERTAYQRGFEQGAAIGANVDAIVIGGPIAGARTLLIGAGTGATVNGTISALTGGSPAAVRGDAAKGAFSGLTTAAAGPLGGDAKASRALAQGAASFASTKATGGDTIQASAAAAATAIASFVGGPSSGIRAGQLVNQLVASFERKTFSASVKVLVPKEKPKNQ